MSYDNECRTGARVLQAGSLIDKVTHQRFSPSGDCGTAPAAAPATRLNSVVSAAFCTAHATLETAYEIENRVTGPSPTITGKNDNQLGDTPLLTVALDLAGVLEQLQHVLIRINSRL